MITIKYIVVVLIILLSIGTMYSARMSNIFIAPFGMLIFNATNGNFTPNKHLIEHGINIKLKKYEWFYYVRKTNNELRISFTSDLIDIDNKIFQMADMHILDQNMSDSLFLKVMQANIGECEQITKKQEIKNGYLAYSLNCLYKGNNFFHYDIPSKKIMITFYPYIDNAKGKRVLRDFLDGIEIK